ncbi:MAG: DUF177 domain-containing protein [Nitrospirota bacterium]
MKILIPEIPEEGLNIDVEENIESDVVRGPVRGQFKIDKVGAEVLVRGKLTADFELQCSRCLKNFRDVAAIHVDVVYHPVEELKGEEHYEIAADELDMDFYTGDELDLSNLINEQTVLNVPMKPLCTETCKGICPRCGQDLNLGSCNCAGRATDPRLEPLKKLLS